MSIRNRILSKVAKFLAYFAFGFLGATSFAISGAAPFDKNTITALYAYKLAKFVQWPVSGLSSEDLSFRFCVLGKNPFPIDTINLIEGKFVKGRRLQVELYETGLVPVSTLSECQLAYVAVSEKHRLGTILSELQNLPVLTVSDIQNFWRQGGMVTLVENDSKIRFQINNAALKRAGLAISSNILDLAELVNDTDP